MLQEAQARQAEGVRGFEADLPRPQARRECNGESIPSGFQRVQNLGAALQREAQARFGRPSPAGIFDDDVEPGGVRRGRHRDDRSVRPLLVVFPGPGR